MNQRSKAGMAVLLGTALFLSASASVFADNSAPAGASSSESSSAAGQHRHRHFRKAMRKVFEACAQANGITLPARGSAEKLSSADRTTLHGCVQTFHETVKSCLQNAGVSKPQPGVAPSVADRAAFKQCRTQALSEVTGSASSSQASH